MVGTKDWEQPGYVTQLMHNLKPLLDEVALLATSPRYPFGTLEKTAVPQSSGLYVIWQDDPPDALYAGRASAKGKPKAQADGLRFRIMENHLGKRGDDNFVRYIGKLLASKSRVDVGRYIREHYSVSWIEVSDPHRLFLLEHLTIAALQPKLNRGVTSTPGSWRCRVRKASSGV